MQWYDGDINTGSGNIPLSSPLNSSSKRTDTPQARPGSSKKQSINVSDVQRPEDAEETTEEARARLDRILGGTSSAEQNVEGKKAETNASEVKDVIQGSSGPKV